MLTMRYGATGDKPVAVAGGGGGGESDIAWLPSVDTSGTISWARSSTTTPPASRNIRGPQGDPGTWSDAPAERVRRIFYGDTDAATYYTAHGLTAQEGDVYIRLG